MSHTAALNDRLRRLKLQEVMSPWRRVGEHAVGGLTEVGYVPGSDLLLAVSASGRSLFDGLSGERVARDRTPLYEVAGMMRPAYWLRALDRPSSSSSGFPDYTVEVFPGWPGMAGAW